ncbi:MAG TPA: LLM class flavin-dependent oxidoreductase, partial [Acetobacteraceae bacterium]|nr:LLM class flavin-dependent oxidoreductase [Acetobacteraceae bacterium]
LLLAAMARKTRHIGLAATLSTAFYHPFHIARAFATLDHISGGRAAWNVVTSANSREAQNFGLDKLMDRNDRYDHADEVMEACDALWNSWDADAIVYDRKRGIYADPSKVHYADYQGKWVRTRGPLPTPRSPQGRPVIMQAGSSKRGRQFAARWAEVIFTLQHSKPDMQAFYTDTTSRRACSSPAAARTSASSHRQSTLCWARPNRSPGSGPSISTAWSAPRSACAISRTLSASIYRNTPSTSDWTIWISLTVREASWTWSCKEPAPVI